MKYLILILLIISCGGNKNNNYKKGPNGNKSVEGAIYTLKPNDELKNKIALKLADDFLMSDIKEIFESKGKFIEQKSTNEPMQPILISDAEVLYRIKEEFIKFLGNFYPLKPLSLEGKKLKDEIEKFLNKEIEPIYSSALFQNKKIEEIKETLIPLLANSKFVKEDVNKKNFLSDIFINFRTREVFFIHKDLNEEYIAYNLVGSIKDNKNFIFNKGFSKNNKFENGKFYVLGTEVPMQDITEQKSIDLEELLKKTIR